MFYMAVLPDIVAEPTQTDFVVYAEMTRPEPCDLCGRRADAFWMGERGVFLCGGCAKGGKAANLVADAIIASTVSNMAEGVGSKITNAVESFNSSLWQALTLALARRPKQLEQIAAWQKQQAEIAAQSIAEKG